jgi:hypothetical protein
MDDDATVRLTRPARQAVPPPPRPGAWARGALLAGLALGLLGVGAALMWWPREAAPPTAERPEAAGAPPTISAPTALFPPALVRPPDAALAGPPLRDEAEIAAHQARQPTAFRWAANPLVFVLDFPDLATQGAAMNRAAAFIEKARAPRDRVLNDAALAEAIAADGTTPAEYYFGHNYRASDLERMFALAERDGVTLNPQEVWLREQVGLARQLDRSRDAAILTIPGVGPDVSPSLRRAILRHELAHGQFFTQPLFAAHVMRVWEQRMTEAEREAVRAFLGREGYDTTQPVMMANEAMAYLLYTPDREVFDPVRELRWSEEQIARVRALFAEGAPPEP